MPLWAAGVDDAVNLNLHEQPDAVGGSGPRGPGGGGGPHARSRNRRAATARPGADSWADSLPRGASACDGGSRGRP